MLILLYLLYHCCSWVTIPLYAWSAISTSSRIYCTSLNVILGPLSPLKFTEQSSTFRPHIPREFPRKPWTLDEVDHWKAAEFRFLLFCTGPFLLKFILLITSYENFLFLHAALSISANNHSCCYVDYTRALLKRIVNTFTYCCGKSRASFNVHSQLHWPDDVKYHGVLYCFSALGFENNMKLKEPLCKHGKPLQQLGKWPSEEWLSTVEEPRE